MKSTFIASTLLGTSSAGAVLRVAPQPCAPLKHSVAPEPNPNTPEAFSTFPFYSEIAKVVAAPKGYEPAIIDGNAAVRSAKYMHYIELESYDVAACAQHCDTARNCKSFNIYFQRNPAVEPSVGCANPEAHPLVTCGLYSHAVDPSEALNVGQSRGPVDANGQAFQVVIRGSNIYNKVADSGSERTVTVTVTAPCTEGLSTTIAPIPSQDTLVTLNGEQTSTLSTGFITLSTTASASPSSRSSTESPASSLPSSAASSPTSSATSSSTSSFTLSTTSSVSGVPTTSSTSYSSSSPTTSSASIQTVFVTSASQSVETVYVTTTITLSDAPSTSSTIASSSQSLSSAESLKTLWTTIYPSHSSTISSSVRTVFVPVGSTTTLSSTRTALVPKRSTAVAKSSSLAIH